MGHIGLTEIVVILVVVLILFGPSKLPELGKAIGKTVNQFRRGLKEGFDDDDDSKSGSKPTRKA